MQQMMLQKRCPICEKKGVKFKLVWLLKHTTHALNKVMYKRHGTKVKCPKCLTGREEIYTFPFLPKGEIIPQDQMVESFLKKAFDEEKAEEEELKSKQGLSGGPGHFSGADVSDDAPSQEPTAESDSHSQSSSDP